VNLKDATSIGRHVRLDGSAVYLKDRSSERKPQAKTAVASRPVGILERLKDFLSLGARRRAPFGLDIDA
jgi:hypothetical protein